MCLPLIAAAATLAYSALAAPVNTSFIDVPSSYTHGFKNPIVHSSAGGQAICVAGMLEITATADNLEFNYPVPANQTLVTELLDEIMQINSTVSSQLITGKKTVSGTYSIYATLCYPKSTGAIDATTIQYLAHGLGFDHRYWDALPGYSYVDDAAAKGYTTFAIDDLGVGQSDIADPISEVQSPLLLEIAHQVIQLLRTGGLAGQAFQRVVGVGHSFGSFRTNGITAKYPQDFDAAILTGFSPYYDGSPIAFAGVDLTIASVAEPTRFFGFSNGYVTSGSIRGTQYFFFRWPQFDQAVLDYADQIKQSISIGEFFTQNGGSVASNFTGPIMVVNGDNDLPNCHGNCLLPVNKAAAVKDAFYPAVSNNTFAWYLAPGTGHGLNMHYTAAAAYEQIFDFLAKNGF